MRGKYAGAMLKATKIGGNRYTTGASLAKAARFRRLAVQAAEKVTHGKVIQAGKIYRDDLVEELLQVLLEKDDKKCKNVKKENPFAKFKKKKKKDDDD